MSTKKPDILIYLFGKMIFLNYRYFKIKLVTVDIFRSNNLTHHIFIQFHIIKGSF